MSGMDIIMNNFYSNEYIIKWAEKKVIELYKKHGYDISTKVKREAIENERKGEILQNLITIYEQFNYYTPEKQEMPS